MAKLNPSIIYSLATDLRELHEIGKEMVKQIEASKIISWRYPDKSSKDINIVVETELFDTGDYVLLLELIIDRLYFILSMALSRLSNIPDLSNTSYDSNLPKNVSKPVGISFGTLVSFLWKRLQCLNSSTVEINKPDSLVVPSFAKSSSDSKTVCDNCSCSYTIVKNVIKCIEECMTMLDFSSKCKECREKCEISITKLSQEDVMKQWLEALIMDLKYIKKHIEQKQIETTKQFKQIIELKHENEAIYKRNNAAQKANAELEKHINEMNRNAEIIVNENQEITKKYSEVAFQLVQMASECKEKKEKLNDIELKIHDIVKKREESISLLKNEFNKQIIIASTERDSYKQENSEYQIRIENLEKTNEELKKQKNELHEANIILQDKCKESKEENLEKSKEDEYISKIQFLDEENLKLKSKIRKSKEREIILLRCPDLNGPIKTKNTTKNPLEDMKQQLEANEIRVSLLKDQNEKLKRVIQKMQFLPTIPE